MCVGLGRNKAYKNYHIIEIAEEGYEMQPKYIYGQTEKSSLRGKYHMLLNNTTIVLPELWLCCHNNIASAVLLRRSRDNHELIAKISQRYLDR